MKTIRINIPEKAYNVHLGRNNLAIINTLLKKEGIAGDLLLVVDSNVSKLHSKIIDHAFHSCPGKIRAVRVNSTEKNKSFATLQKIHKALIKYSFGRDSAIVAIGGGIVGDVAGFAASTYMRGINYIQIPTTLLSAVDSSVGGKTGINFGDTKNIVGSFYQPKLVLIDTDFFDTLPLEERLCGLGEIVKYCFLTDQKFFNYVKNNFEKIINNDSLALNKVITESIHFKGGVVEADERESGIRKVLNLGHTFAHAFEVQQKHKLKHGQAVVIGIVAALYLSNELGFITKDHLKKFLELLLLFEEKIHLSRVDKNQIYKIMLLDKKNRANQIKFVLLKSIGQIITDVPADKKIVHNSMAKAIKHFQNESF